jgi:hypothetical protein
VARGSQISDRAAGLSFIALGGLLLSVTLAVAAPRVVFLLRASNAEATVIGDLVAPGRRGAAHCPVFSYTPAGATRSIDVESNQCRSGAALRAGSKVRVLYDPGAPDGAVMEEGYPLLLALVGAFGLMGLVFIGGGVVLFRRHAKKADGI